MISKNKIKNELIKTKWKKEYFEKKKINAIISIDKVFQKVGSQ